MRVSDAGSTDLTIRRSAGTFPDFSLSQSHSETPAQHGKPVLAPPFGVRFFRLKCLPRVRKERVPGANVLSRLRRAQPGGLPRNLPRVERFVRHPGLETIR